MGNNESLPPPPPPGQPPHVPNNPPPPPGAPQQYPPTQQVPSQQYPPTQQVPSQYPPQQGYPQQQYPQQQYAPQGYAPQGYPPQPAAPKKNKTPLLIGAGVVVAGGIVAAVLALGGGDDNKTATPTTLSTVVESTDAPSDTFVITTPENTESVITAPVITELPPGDTEGGSSDGVIFVNDDTGVFSVALLDTFQTDTAPVDANGIQLPQVSGATDINAYSSDHDTFGITVIVGPSDQLEAPASLPGIFDPGTEVCASRTSQSGYTTSQGPGELMLLDGCGTGGAFAKVILVVPLAGNQTIIALAQGPSPSNGDLLTFTQAVVETVSLL